MEPQSTKRETTESLEPTNNCAWYTPLCRVSRTSKFLAALTMIVLPFVGGYVGYQLATDADYSNNGLRPVSDLSLNEFTEYAYTQEEIAQFEQLKKDFENKILAERLKREVELYIGTSTQKYEPEETTQSDAGFGWLVYQSSPDTEILLSDQVKYLDENAKLAASKPYLNYVSNFDTSIILTAGCFRATECSYAGLYTYDAENHTLRTMKTGSHYIEMETGSVLSPDKTKLALAPFRGKQSGTDFGYIDLVNDVYHSLEILPTNGRARFTVCEMGCWIDAKWLTDNQLSATLLEFGQCDQYGQCSSIFKDESGIEYETTRPISTTTKTWSI